MIVIVCAADSFAQPATSCAPELMQAMEARSWMETNRENVQTRNLMTRPDSVFEYSCFDQLVTLVAIFPASIFSGSGATGNALQQVVSNGLSNYLSNNFGHNYLGDRAETHVFTPSGSYDCETLNYVWEQAKCMDLGEFRGTIGPDRTDWDMFYDFYWYEGNDPRNLPAAATACTSSGDWNRAIRASFNDDNPDRQSDRYILDAALEVLFNTTPYDVELAQPSNSAITDMYSRMMVEGSHTLFNSCITIPTGIQVVRTTGVSGTTANYPDASCPNPQCFYNQSSCTQ